MYKCFYNLQQKVPWYDASSSTHVCIDGTCIPAYQCIVKWLEDNVLIYLFLFSQQYHKLLRKRKQTYTCTTAVAAV